MSDHKSNSSIEQSLEILTNQVGRLTEGMTEFRADMAEIKELVREQSQVSKQQAETAARLVQIVEKLLDTKVA